MLTGLIVAVLFGAIATGGAVQLADGAPSFARDPTPAAPVTTIAPVTAADSGGTPPEPLELPAFVEVIARVFFYGCLVVFAGVVLMFAWRHRPDLRVRRPRRPEAVEFDALDDVADAVSADAEAQRSALQRGVPRNAIVECWLRLESTVVDAGVPRYPSDTSAEFTERAPRDRVRGPRCDCRPRSALSGSSLLGSSDGRGLASCGDRSTRRGPCRAPSGPPIDRDEPVSSWKRPVAVIIGATIAVEVFMVVTGMGPQVVLVAALGGLVGAGVWFLADLADVTDGGTGVAVGATRESAARTDRRVMQLRNGLAYGRPDRASLLQLRATLVDLVDDQLRAVHLVDRAQQPEAARAVMSDDLYAFVTDPDSATMLTEPRRVDHIVTLIERL